MSTRADRPEADGAASGAGASGGAPDVEPASGPLHQDVPRRPGDFGIDVRRLRRLRLIVFGILALPLLALSLLAIKFVSMPVTQWWQDDAYGRKDYDTAIERLEPVWVANWFEPYLPHLTRGTDLLQKGDDAAAEKELRIALETWENGKDLNKPQHAQCKILNNLAISIERQADTMTDPAARGDRLFEAEQLLAPCGGGGGGDGSDGGGGGQGNEDKETTGENGKRIEEKRKEADKDAGKDPADRESPASDPGEETGGNKQPPSGGGSHEDPSGTEPPQEATTQGNGESQRKKDELDERNRKANDGQGESSENGGSQDPEKPW